MVVEEEEMSDHYVCVGCGGHPDYSCYEYAWKFYCGPCFDNAKLQGQDAELSALRAEVEAIKVQNRAEVEGLTRELQEMVDSAEAEVARLRKVADAAREYRKAEQLRAEYVSSPFYNGRGYALQSHDEDVEAERASLDAALAGLGEPTSPA